MTVELDQTLVIKARRIARRMDFSDCVAANLLHRRKVRATVLARVFRVSKNTLYYRALTGTANSYPTLGAWVRAVEEEIERLGVTEAERVYLNASLVAKVNAELARVATANEAAFRAKWGP